jgi:BirA family biotin operon repressor/biotin-[acetyl-CoA-carboxylase] ligase
MQELNTSQINAGINNSYWRVLVLAETTSTQDELLIRNLTKGDVVVAEYQSKGRGRLDRSFESKKYAGLTFSFIPNLNLDRELWGSFPILVGATLADLFSELTNLDFKSKWPNDVISKSNQKLLGILTEIKNDQIHCGIGINVNTSKADLPVENATSLFLETGKEFDRNLLLAEILTRIEKSINLLQTNPEAAREYAKSNCGTIGQEIEVQPVTGESYQAKAIDLSLAGELVLANGEKLHVGEIKHLKVS